MAVPLLGLLARFGLGGARALQILWRFSTVARVAGLLSGASSGGGGVGREIRGLAQLRYRMDVRAKAMQNMLPAYKQCSVFLDRWVQLNFRGEGDKVGGWVKSQRAIRQHGKTLQDTGRLRQSFKPWATSRNAGIRSDLPYAKKHHEGWGHTPERRLLPTRAEIRADVRRIFREHMHKAIERK